MPRLQVQIPPGNCPFRQFMECGGLAAAFELDVCGRSEKQEQGAVQNGCPAAPTDRFEMAMRN